MAEEVEVDPDLGTAAFRASKYCPIEVTGRCKIVDGEGDVKGAQGGHEKFHIALQRPS
jgi:hypothetical protein